MAEPRQILSIQYLRALAALSVVVFHNLELSANPFGVGAAGVDLFFIISGFVMWTLADAQQPSPPSFLWRRIIRIVPLYWVITLGAALGATLFSGLFWKFDPSFDNIWKSLLFVPHASQIGGWSPVVAQGWTLNFEMFFYALFAVTLLAPARGRFYWLSGALVGLVALGFLYRSSDPAWDTYTNPLLLEFLGGALLGVAWRRGYLPGFSVSIFLLTFGFAILAFEEALGIYDLSMRVLNWGAPSFLLVAGALGVERSGGVPKLKAPLLLGDASYSIYLLHSFVTIGVFNLFRGLDAGWHTLIATPLSAAAGVASYLVFEKPVTKVLKTLNRKREAAPTAAV